MALMVGYMIGSPRMALPHPTDTRLRSELRLVTILDMGGKNNNIVVGMTTSHVLSRGVEKENISTGQEV